MSDYSLVKLNYIRLKEKRGFMNYNLVKANLNLYAVLKNLEDLTIHDKEMKELINSWDLSIQFIVRNGPKAFIEFKKGGCIVGQGRYKSPSIILYFFSPLHLNKMFDGTASPIPLKGLSKIRFLTKEFPKLTDRLSYYLKPENELLKNNDYLKLNTIMLMNTAAFALPEIANLDSTGRIIASHMPEGIIEMKILPDFHSVNITFGSGRISARKGKAIKPSAVMAMKNVQVANAFLNGKTDPFTAIAAGDVVIKGIIPMLDAISLMLDRIPEYIS